MLGVDPTGIDPLASEPGTPATIIEVFKATLSFMGSLGHNIAHVFIVQLTSSGILQRDITHRLSGILSSAGALSFSIARKVFGSLSFTGNLEKNIDHPIVGKLTSLGSLNRNGTHPLAAFVSFSGILQKTTKYTLTATLMFLGSLQQIAIRRFEAALIFTGSMQRRIMREFAAFLVFSTRLVDYVIHVLSASFAFVGTLSRRIEFIKRFVANLGFEGVLTANVFHAVVASIAFIGSIASRIITRIQTATLNSSASLHYYVTRRFEVMLSFVAIQKRNITHRVPAELTFLGLLKLTKNFLVELVASFSFSEVTYHSTTHALEGSMASVGSLRRSIVRRIESILTAIGDAQRGILHRLTGELSTSSEIFSKIHYALDASLMLVGVTRLAFIQTLKATLDLGGQIARRSIVRILRGALDFIGFVFPRNKENEPHLGAVLLQFIRGPDQLTHNLYSPSLTLRVIPSVPDRFVRSEPMANITEISPGNFRDKLSSSYARLYSESNLTLLPIKSDLPNDDPKLVKMRNQTVLITYDDLSHTVREVSKSYYED